MTTTTTTEPTTAHPRGARRDPHLRRPARTTRVTEPAAVDDRLADGRRRLPDASPRHFTDRTVVTYDPRGVERSDKTDPASQSTPEHHADDVHRVIEELGVGPVDLFASSGGAINALALVATHPEDVRTLVAHEPPLASLVPDREFALAACQDIHETYQRERLRAPAMAQFIAIVSHERSVHRRVRSRSRRPIRRCSGCRPRTTARATTRCSARTCITCTPYEPDFDALRAASTRVVIAVGAESEGKLAQRGGEAVAERLGTEASCFPSDHGGFMGGEYGQTGEPGTFAAKLREVLAAS